MKITDLVKKPSEALQAMVDGLKHQSKRADFVVSMGTFGTGTPDTKLAAGRCYGCCATCAVQEIAKKDLDNKNIGDIYARARALVLDRFELDKFENAIDDARSGNLRPLFQFFYGDEEYSIMKIDRSLVYPEIRYTDDNWREENKKMLAHIKLLQKAGY